MKKLLIPLLFLLSFCFLSSAYAITQARCMTPEVATIIFVESNPGTNFLFLWEGEKAKRFNEIFNELPPKTDNNFSHILGLSNPAYSIDLVAVFNEGCLSEYFPVPRSVVRKFINAIEGNPT